MLREKTSFSDYKYVKIFDSEVEDCHTNKKHNSLKNDGRIIEVSYVPRKCSVLLLLIMKVFGGDFCYRFLFSYNNNVAKSFILFAIWRSCQSLFDYILLLTIWLCKRFIFILL